MSSAQLKFTTVGVTSFYGWRVLKASGLKNLHKGVDTANGSKYPHSVFGDGVVKFAGSRKYGHPDYERGLHVIVEHAPGIETSYHSLSNLAVVTGQPVKMGDIIGYAGRSAVGASGDHVHNGLWLNGAHVDPLKYLTPGVVVTVTNGGSLSSVAAEPFIEPFQPEKDLRSIVALKDTLTIYSAPSRGYLVVGPGFTREIVGNERLEVLGKTVGIDSKVISNRDWDVIAEFFRGNDEQSGRVTPAQIEQLVKASLAGADGKVSTDDLTAEIVEGVRGLFAKAGA